MKSVSINSTKETPVSAAILKRLVDARLRGDYLPSYFVDKKLGDIWSNKLGYFRKLTPNVSGTAKYPKVRISFGKKGDSLGVSVHRIVAETLIPIPMPTGVTEKEWKRTPASVKALFNNFWEVNHIDHDRSNFNPKNLEWVFNKENREKYYLHAAKK